MLSVMLSETVLSPVNGASDPDGRIQTAVLLHYDTTSTVSTSELHTTLERALMWLQNQGFPMDKVIVTTWRDTLDNAVDYQWLQSTLQKHNVSISEGQLGLYVAPEDTNSPRILAFAMETFKNTVGKYPYFVAGSSVSANTYPQLVSYGVKVSFMNLWEEGEDYTYRGYCTNDRLHGANWEGSPAQPYKPSKYTASAPGQSAADELDLWEAHWITRNPSYAYLEVNSRNMGSIHPHDLMLQNTTGDQICSTTEAVQRLNTMLDLVDYNACYNELTTVSYPVEISFLCNSDVFSVWQSTIQEFENRNYAFVNAQGLRNNLESLQSQAPHTPTYLWYDNLTNSDTVVRGENTPFAMVTSTYGRFIYARRDPLKDSGTPLVSIVSYTTARAYDESFQSIRELMGVDAYKMNTYVNGVPVEMRFPDDIQNVTITPGKAIAIHWTYLKGNVPYAKYNVTTTLTAQGILIEKDLSFTQVVNASVALIHHVFVQENLPVAPSDANVRLETDLATSRRFSATIQSKNELPLDVNASLTFVATDGYTLGLTFTSGKPDSIRAFDEAGNAAYESLEFDYLLHEYQNGETIHLAYAISPATSLQNAQALASAINETAHSGDAIAAPAQIPELSLPLLAVLIVGATALLVIHRIRRETLLC